MIVGLQHMQRRASLRALRLFALAFLSCLSLLLFSYRLSVLAPKEASLALLYLVYFLYLLHFLFPIAFFSSLNIFLATSAVFP